MSHLYKSAHAALQFCSSGLYNATKGKEKVSAKQSGLCVKQIATQTLVYLKVASTNSPVRERDDDKNATTGSGQLVYGKEFQTKVFKVQSGIRYTSAVGFTAVRVTGVTIHDPSCCARLNTPSLTGIPHGV